MINLNHPKIEGLLPVWKAFRGFSLLFDPPKDSFDSKNNHSPKFLEVDLTQPTLNFFYDINEAVKKIKPAPLLTNYGLCLVPPSSYHVTLWDGINDENLSKIVSPTEKQLFSSLLSQLPNRLLHLGEFRELLISSPILSQTWDIRFQGKRLHIFKGSQALVLEIQPDQESKSEFDKLLVERERLYQQFEAHLGLQMMRSYTPHITLGYFINSSATNIGLSQLPSWNKHFETCFQANNKQIHFSSVSLYAFTDMASYYQFTSL